MQATTYLAGDLGGTKTLLAIYSDENGKLKQEHVQRYVSAEWTSLNSMLNHFLQTRPDTNSTPQTSCFAVAGPVKNRAAELTNLGWSISQESLKQSAGLEQVELVNDFAVLIYGLPHFSDSQQITLQEGSTTASESTQTEQGPVAILGAGTGLGMARGLPSQQGWIALPSEGGHREFAPRCDDEWALVQWLKHDLSLERISVERVVSGTGLGHVMHWMLQQSEQPNHPLHGKAEAWRWNTPDHPDYHDLPASTCQYAKAGDQIARAAMTLWLSAYGAAAGDLALQELCTGGLWIGGGTAEKNQDGLKSNHFLNAMRQKGRFQPFLERLTVRAVIDPQAGLFSAACRARELAESSGKLT
jgi:glucokinase